jgi:hypothetical protein
MKCRTCGTEIAEKALICYRCGTATSERKHDPYVPPSSGTSRIVWIVIAVALLVSLAWFLLE